ncbi:hypothetical protein ACHWQZ_G015289 [Mnemiopsis leidyi]
MTSTAVNSTAGLLSGPDITSSSSSPLPTIVTKTPRPDIPEQVRLTVEDMALAGDLLGAVVLVSIIMNIYTMFVVSKNWKVFVLFPFAQSNIICMFLSFADLLLGLLLGLPTAIHLRFADYFSEQYPKVMVHYSRTAGFFLLDYMFIFRSIIIAGICIDRCVHILRPLAYKFWVSNRLTVCICAAMTLFPLLTRVVPQLIYLNIGTGEKKPHIVCSSFRNPDRSESTHHSTVDFVNFTIPLTCVVNVWIEDKSSSNMVGLDAEQVQSSWPHRVATAELILYASTLALTFLSIVICNIVILVVIVRRTKARNVMTCTDQNSMKKKVKQSIHKNLLATSIMAVVFLISNGPVVVLSVVDYLLSFLNKYDIGVSMRTGDDRLKLYLTLSMFISLLVNPWLYPLRMETIRKFFPCFKHSLRDTIRQNVSETRTQIFSRLSRQLQSPKLGKKINLSSITINSHRKERNKPQPAEESLHNKFNPPQSNLYLQDNSLVLSNSLTLGNINETIMVGKVSPTLSLQTRKTVLSSSTEVIELDQIYNGVGDVIVNNFSDGNVIIGRTMQSSSADDLFLRHNIYAEEMEI